METRLEVQAYAADCLIRGSVSFDGERLTDFLASSTEYHFQSVELTALEDGRTIRLDDVTIPRQELLAVIAAGPRGNSGRRVRTRPHPILVGVGPYEVAGYLHAIPTADAVTTALQRRFVPLTDGWLRQRIGGEIVEQRFATLIINRTEIAWLERGTANDLATVAPPQMPVAIDPGAKDLTPLLMFV
jgi:hypothetical protein